jgi:hypothetical protein
MPILAGLWVEGLLETQGGGGGRWGCEKELEEKEVAESGEGGGEEGGVGEGGHRDGN